MTEIVWPESLVQEIADRRCILFLGSGISASAVDENGVGPKTWEDFLKNACGLIRNESRRGIVEELIAKDKYLVALEAISSEADPGDYKRLINRCYNSPQFKPGILHKIIYDLDARIVISTNFDNIYEQYWTHFSKEGFKIVHYYDGSLGDEIRNDTRLIIKAHGSVNNANKMIFTRSEYHGAKRDHPHFYELLRALFLTHTVVFLGCGMNDPDVLLVLEEVNISSSAARPHYAVVREHCVSSYVLEDLRKSYNVKVLEYGPDHPQLSKDLARLLEEVEEIRATGLGAEQVAEAFPESGASA